MRDDCDELSLCSRTVLIGRPTFLGQVTSRYVTMIVNNAKLWPGVGLLNFGLVPKNLRVLVTNFVAVFWGYLMSKWVK